MRYNLSIHTEIEKARTKLEFLIKKGVRVDITEKRKGRSLSQNSFLHLCLVAYAYAYGDTISYIKQEVWKKQLCPHIFKIEVVNRITGEVREGYRSSAELNTKEMTDAIEILRNSASKDLGTYISTPEDLIWIDQIKNLEEENKQFI